MKSIVLWLLLVSGASAAQETKGSGDVFVTSNDIIRVSGEITFRSENGVILMVVNVKTHTLWVNPTIKSDKFAKQVIKLIKKYVNERGLCNPDD